jgi:RimJ/RimL family protein N-acetyltransferase
MLKRSIITLRSAVALFKMAGLKAFLGILWRQIYCKDIQIGMELNLDGYNPPQFTCKLKYNLKIASEADMNEAFGKIKTECKESREILLYMKWLYECGFRNWYIARTADTNEVCFLMLVIRPEDNRLIERSFKTWFPRIKENEVIIEAAYAYDKYRGQGLTTSAHIDIINLCKAKGIKRNSLYIKRDNLPSFKTAEKIGYKKFEEVPIRKTLFFTRRKFTRPN